MKLRFEVDQAECFRRGIDAPASVVTIDVKPAELPQDERDLIADRLDGIDVCQLTFDSESRTLQKAYHSREMADPNPKTPLLMLAEEPTYKALIEACKENALRKHRR